MKRTLYTLILGVLALSSYADIRNGWMVYGRSINSFTFERIKGTVVELMQTDSTVVQTDTIHPTMDFFQFIVDGTQKEYILRLSHPDYETTYKNLTLALRKRERTIEIGNVPMRRLTMAEKGITLDEVEIVTSKVQFYHKGDTLIYDATAFQIAEGSMLDALIEQLPGVELKGNQILVNGRYVESLLVNGKDFFRGDPSVALQNLPAYMVNKVKVYEKEHEDAHVIGNLKEKPLVVDVNLKKEFSTGWISNVEAGYGTGEHYLGRMFGLLFTKQMRLSVFGNMNNTSDTRLPGSQGDWNPAWQASGVTDMKLGGLDFRWDNKEETFGVESNLKVYGEDEHTESATSATNFYDDGDVYSRSRKKERDNQLHIMSDHRLYGKGKY